jgi:hypothetical protein
MERHNSGRRGSDLFVGIDVLPHFPPLGGALSASARPHSPLLRATPLSTFHRTPFPDLRLRSSPLSHRPALERPLCLPHHLISRLSSLLLRILSRPLVILFRPSCRLPRASSDMNSGPAAPLNELERRHRLRRAARACLPCHKRKVRCDVATYGEPCSNCAYSELACVPKEKTFRRTRNADRSGLLPSLANVTAPSATEPSPARFESPGVNYSGRSKDDTPDKADEDVLSNNMLANPPPLDLVSMRELSRPGAGAPPRTDEDRECPFDEFLDDLSREVFLTSIDEGNVQANVLKDSFLSTYFRTLGLLMYNS